MEPKESFIEKTLESLDGITKAKANPFLATRIMSRMNNRNEARFVQPATLRISFLIGLLLIGINFFSLLHYSCYAKLTIGYS